MSYSDDKKMINSISEYKRTEGLIDFLTNDPEPIDSSFPIETLVEKIIEKQCDIHFKAFIKNEGEYNNAHGAACNALIFYTVKRHNYIQVWIRECLSCFDVILLTYYHTLGEDNIKSNGEQVSERSLYKAFTKSKNEALEIFGHCMDHVYHYFRNPQTHRIHKTKEGEVYIREYKAQAMWKAWEVSNRMFAEALEFLLPRISTLIEE